MANIYQSAGVAPAPTTYALRGHSGARLTLIEEVGRTYVQKAAVQPAQNARLRQQCLKLQAAHADGVPCPEVYRAEEADGLFFFDMEFISGDGVSHAIVSRRALDWDQLAAQLTAFLERLRATAGDDIPEQEFRGKLSSILDASRRNPFLGHGIAAVEHLTERLTDMDWTGIPHSECHGDMTLENLLVRPDGSLCFLDFDVPEHNSWLLDLGKIYQDLIGHWCLRHIAIQQPDSADLLNAQMALGRAAQRLTRALEPLLSPNAHRLGQLASFHLLRTLPYARSAEIPAYVIARAQQLLAK